MVVEHNFRDNFTRIGRRPIRAGNYCGRIRVCWQLLRPNSGLTAKLGGIFSACKICLQAFSPRASLWSCRLLIFGSNWPLSRESEQQVSLIWLAEVHKSYYWFSSQLPWFSLIPWQWLHKPLILTNLSLSFFSCTLFRRFGGWNALRGKGGKNVGRDYDLDSILQGIDLSFRVTIIWISCKIFFFSPFFKVISVFLVHSAD